MTVFNQNAKELMNICKFSFGDVKKLYDFEVKRGLTSSFSTSVIKWICKNYILFNSFRKSYNEFLGR